ncbi:MAG: hypothetical protein HZC36_07695 [Armatimonadetes bacterium]|nr:hypothetical protein [Armatimonadota bacterium]
MFLPIALCLACAAVEEAVTFSFEVGRAEMAVAALAKETGLPMKTAGPVGTETVFLKVDGLSVQAVMDSLARTTAAEWSKKDDGTYVLARTQAIIRRETLRETDRRLTLLNSWRAKLVNCLRVPFDERTLLGIVKERAALEDNNEDQNRTEEQQQRTWDRIQELDRCDPVYRVLARCLQGLDLRPVATLPSQACLVYALHPNAVQKQLPPSAVDALRLLQPEQVAWGKALKTKPLKEGEDADSRFWTDHTIRFFASNGPGSVFGARSDPWARTLPFEGNPTEVLLTVSGYSEDSFRFSVQVFGSKDQLIMSFDCDGASTFDKKEALFGAKELEFPTPAPSPETRALWARMKGSGESVKGAIKVLQRFLDDPERNEPLWLGNQEMLSTLADFNKRSVIACLPDDTRFDFDEALDLHDYFRSTDLRIAETDKLIELAPRRFASHWAHRASRAAMASCAMSYRTQGRIDLLTYVALVAPLGDSADRSFPGLFVQLIDPDYRSSYASFELPFQSNFVGLLSTLSSEQLGLLKGGQTIPYASLTPNQKELASRIVFGVRVNVEIEGSARRGLFQESPTEELPNGLLQGAGLSAEFGEDTIAVFHNPLDPRFDEFYSTNLKNTRGPMMWSGPPPRVPEGGMANATVTLHPQNFITLKCALSPGHFVVGHFAEPRRKATQAPVPINQLPDEVQKKLEATVKFLDGMGARWGGEHKPPPR